MKKLLSFVLFCTLFSFVFAENIIFSADGMTGQAGNSNSTTVLEGEAFVQTDTIKIQADRIELSGQNYRNIVAEGNVTGQNLETAMEFSCDTLSFDRTTKVASLQGNVSLTDKENDVEAKAQIIEYNQETDTAIMQIQIQLKQKDNQCQGSYAIYLKKQQLLELSGNAQITQKGDVFRAQHITLNMKTQEITLDGNVRGTVKETKNKESEPAAETEKNSAATDSKDKKLKKKAAKDNTAETEQTEKIEQAEPAEQTEASEQETGNNE